MTCTTCHGTGRNLGVLWGQAASIICTTCRGTGRYQGPWHIPGNAEPHAQLKTNAADQAKP